MSTDYLIGFAWGLAQYLQKKYLPRYYDFFLVKHHPIVRWLCREIKTWPRLAIYCALEIKYFPYVSVRIFPSICQKLIPWIFIVVEDMFVVDGGLRLCRNKQVSEEIQQQQYVCNASSRSATEHQQCVMWCISSKSTQPYCNNSGTATCSAHTVRWRGSVNVPTPPDICFKNSTYHMYTRRYDRCDVPRKIDTRRTYKEQENVNTPYTAT